MALFSFNDARAQTESVIKELEQQLAQRDETIRSMRWRMAELSKAVRRMQEEQKAA